MQDERVLTLPTAPYVIPVVASVLYQCQSMLLMESVFDFCVLLLVKQASEEAAFFHGLLLKYQRLCL